MYALNVALTKVKPVTLAATLNLGLVAVVLGTLDAVNVACAETVLEKWVQIRIAYMKVQMAEFWKC